MSERFSLFLEEIDAFSRAFRELSGTPVTNQIWTDISAICSPTFQRIRVRDTL